MLWETQFFSPGSKEAKISRLISRWGEFISDRFSWKRMDVTEVGRKSWVKGKATCQVLCPEDLHSWWDGLRGLHIDGWVKVVPAPHPPTNVPPVWRVVSPDSDLAPDHLLSSFVKHIGPLVILCKTGDQRQIVKVRLVN